MDDFGIGYSSLVQLHRMPFNELKIDRSFIINLDETSDTLPIVKSIIGLAKNMNLAVTAEGVESLETWNILEHNQCDYAQGYFISQPLELAAFLDFIKQDKILLQGQS